MGVELFLEGGALRGFDAQICELVPHVSGHRDGLGRVGVLFKEGLEGEEVRVKGHIKGYPLTDYSALPTPIKILASVLGFPAEPEKTKPEAYAPPVLQVILFGG